MVLPAPITGQTSAGDIFVEVPEGPGTMVISAR
jgi:hypothetical protein